MTFNAMFAYMGLHATFKGGVRNVRHFDCGAAVRLLTGQSLEPAPRRGGTKAGPRSHRWPDRPCQVCKN